MKLNGAKINFLGDSITEGCGTSSPEHRFTDVLAREYGVIPQNHGIGGTRYARQTVPSEWPLHDLDFCGRYAQMPLDADAVVVFGGTNDYGHGDAPFGTQQDTTAATFCGACYELYSGLKDRYPKAKILILTPLHRCNDTSVHGEGNHSLRPPLSEYARVEKETAEGFGFAVMDLFNMGLLDPNDPATLTAYVPDGLHPNDEGQYILAKAIAAKLEAL